MCAIERDGVRVSVCMLAWFSVKVPYVHWSIYQEMSEQKKWIFIQTIYKLHMLILNEWREREEGDALHLLLFHHQHRLLLLLFFSRFADAFGPFISYEKWPIWVICSLEISQNYNTWKIEQAFNNSTNCFISDTLFWCFLLSLSLTLAREIYVDNRQCRERNEKKEHVNVEMKIYARQTDGESTKCQRLTWNNAATSINLWTFPSFRHTFELRPSEIEQWQTLFMAHS